jgi:hypothetical protein
MRRYFALYPRSLSGGGNNSPELMAVNVSTLATLKYRVVTGAITSKLHQFIPDILL